MKNKLCELRAAVNLCCYDFLCFTETWLSSDVMNDEVLPENFAVFRADRKFSITGRSRGGGVLVGVKSEYASSVVEISSPFLDDLPEIDLICVKLYVNCQVLYIILLYMPPGSPSASYDAVVDCLCSCSFISCSNTILLGDFNVPDFGNCSELLSGRAQNLNNMSAVLDLRQINHIQNKHGRFLDLIFVNFACDVLRASDVLLGEDDHHPALECLSHLQVREMLAFHSIHLIFTISERLISLGYMR